MKGRPAGWRVLVVIAVMAATATVIYVLHQHRSGAHTATHPAAEPSPSAAIVQLRQSFLPDPPYGPGVTTRGTYVQVSGFAGLDTVNAALRQLIVDDQAQDRAVLAQGGPWATTPPGEYGSGPGEQPAISASSVVVSVLLKTEIAPPDGEFHESWVSATLLVPSAHPVQLASLFADPTRGLAAISAAAKEYLLANVPCVAQALTSQIAGDVAAAGLDPTTPTNFQHFATTPNGLVIGFDQEQIGPHACGNVAATIAWNTLRPLLSPVGAWLTGQLR
jgi:hypothetical protein